MARRLPVAMPRPSIDAVRKRLGGRNESDAGVGDLVELHTAQGAKLNGVVLFADGDHLDVYTVPSLVRRVHRNDTTALSSCASANLVALAQAAKVFATLWEGQRVRFEVEGIPSEGTLAEKCRYGALVARDDGTLMGVGFRGIRPAETN